MKQPDEMTPEWSRLEALRQIYLQGTGGQADYWSDPALLAAYDQTFAQRIGWKWQWVLSELDRLGWRPSAGPLLDWGCGSGIASRTVQAHYGEAVGSEFYFFDRSSQAMTYAAEQMKKQSPTVITRTINAPTENAPAPTTILLSHILTELDEAALAMCLKTVRTAQTIIWVEPGAKEVSRRLSRVRDALIDDFTPIAPCVARGQCPVLAAGQEHDWCHFFAPPPAEAFTTGAWAAFARTLGIDLRSLPVSYLVLSRQPPPSPPHTSADLPPAHRVLGTPRFYKGYARIFSCDGAVAREQRFSKRQNPALFKAWEKNRLPTLLHWHAQDDEITDLTLPPEL
jgi:hypothetical protein